MHLSICKRNEVFCTNTKHPPPHVYPAAIAVLRQYTLCACNPPFSVVYRLLDQQLNNCVAQERNRKADCDLEQCLFQAAPSLCDTHAI